MKMKWTGFALAMALGGRAWGMAQEPSIGVSLAGYTHALVSGSLQATVTVDVTLDPGAGNPYSSTELACSNSPIQLRPGSNDYDTSGEPVVVLKTGLPTVAGSFQVAMVLNPANVAPVVFQEGVTIHFAVLMKGDPPNSGTGGVIDPDVGDSLPPILSASLPLTPDNSPADQAVITVVDATESSLTVAWIEPADHCGALLQDVVEVDLRYSDNPILDDNAFNAATRVQGIAPQGRGKSVVHEVGGFPSLKAVSFAVRFGDGDPHNNWGARSNSVTGSTVAFIAGGSGSAGCGASTGADAGMLLALLLAGSVLSVRSTEFLAP